MTRFSKTSIFTIALSLAASVAAAPNPAGYWKTYTTSTWVETAPTATPAPVAPVTSPSNPSTGTTPPAAGTFTGEVTHWDVGLGSCGTTNSNSEDVVALAVDMMANPVNPNLNPKCGKTITLINKAAGTTTQAKVVDTCGGCKYGDVDLSPSLFSKVAPKGDGRVGGIQWHFN